jgi:hypothetical protein
MESRHVVKAAVGEAGTGRAGLITISRLEAGWDHRFGVAEVDGMAQELPGLLGQGGSF